MSLLLGLVSLKPRSIRGDENRRQKPGKTRNKPGVRAEPGNRIEDGNGRRRITDEQNDGWLKNGCCQTGIRPRIFFVCDIFDAAPKDDLGSMEHPIFFRSLPSRTAGSCSMPITGYPSR